MECWACKQVKSKTEFGKNQKLHNHPRCFLCAHRHRIAFNGVTQAIPAQMVLGQQILEVTHNPEGPVLVKTDKQIFTICAYPVYVHDLQRRINDKVSQVGTLKKQRICLARERMDNTKTFVIDIGFISDDFLYRVWALNQLAFLNDIPNELVEHILAFHGLEMDIATFKCGGRHINPILLLGGDFYNGWFPD